jgi:hypothetical protein
MGRKFALRSGCALFVMVLGIAAAGAQEASVVQQLPTAGADLKRLEADLAAAQSSKSDDIIELSSKSGGGVPPLQVPLFLPEDVLTDLSKGSSKSGDAVQGSGSGGCGSGGLIVPTDGGYSAACDLGRYDLVIEGSRNVFGDGGSKSVARSADYLGEFAEGEAGGSITFGYANAHYVAFFDCKDGSEQCIAADEAKSVIDRLLLCSTTAGKCLRNGASQIRP